MGPVFFNILFQILLLSALLFTVENVVAETISGRVVNRHGTPLSDATVRVQGASVAAVTDNAGRFTLTGLKPSQSATITAWKDGYYSKMTANLLPPASGIGIQLLRYHLSDHADYSWIPPTGPHPGSCANCHSRALMEPALQDPHMNSANNHRFLSIYFGTDLQGNRNPEREYHMGMGAWGNSYVPKPYDKNKPYYGPGFATDKTGMAGNCSACHLPAESIRRNVAPSGHSKTSGTVSKASGIHCDFCHKVAAIRYDPVTKLPFPNVVGVHGMEVLRPSGKKGHEYEQIFFGPYDDPNSTTSTKLPVLSQSLFCATCHRGQFWGKLVYNSYGEWLDSPYSKEGSKQFKSCQQCHMQSPVKREGRLMTNTAPGKGGLERPASTFRSHRMTIDGEILKNSLTMTATARKESGRLLVDLELYNDKTGHHIPTDSPLRHLILHIEARDAQGRLLKQTAGPVLPDWTGSSGKVKAVAAFAGKPGKAFAKLLKGNWTEEFPTADYWNDFEIVSDNRIAAFARDASSYAFEAPAAGRAVVKVSLYYRRAYYQLMEWKKWSDPDILMAEKGIRVP